jgi:putative peptidoglycan lipid II flippase
MRAFLRQHLGQHRILGGALVLSVTQLAASVAGLLRDRLLAKTFPDLAVVDVYIAAFRPSDLLFQIAIMAGISTVLVPLLARYKANNRRSEMSSLLTSVIAVGSLVFGILALALAIALPRIAPLLVGFEGDSLALYISFARLALLTNFLFVAGNALGQLLITEQRYWVYGITPILYTVGTIVGTIWLTPLVGAFGPIYGTVGGAVAYVLIRLLGACGTGFRMLPRFWHRDLITMGWLMLPRMMALGALQFELLVFDGLASRLPAGAVTINAYARNFQSVVVGAIGIALAQSAFSLLSQAAAREERERFWIYLRKGTGLLLLLSIPAAIGLAFLAPVAAWLVHLTHVLPVFGAAIAIYAVSIPFESVNHLLLRSYYALHRTGIPAVMNVLNGLSAVAVSFALLSRYGVYALAIGFAVGQGIQLLGLAILLPQRVRALQAKT